MGEPKHTWWLVSPWVGGLSGSVASGKPVTRGWSTWMNGGSVAQTPNGKPNGKPEISQINPAHVRVWVAFR
jgi:hypothetical protein